MHIFKYNKNIKKLIVMNGSTNLMNLMVLTSNHHQADYFAYFFHTLRTLRKINGLNVFFIIVNKVIKIVGSLLKKF